MSLYLDTALLVAALTNEAESGRIQRWLGQQEPGSLVISDWVTTEFSSALSIKLRTGQIESDHRADALAMFARLTADHGATLCTLDRRLGEVGPALGVKTLQL